MVSGKIRLADPDETIVALATPAQPGTRAVVRLSGRNVQQVLREAIPDFRRDPVNTRQYWSGGIELSGIARPLPAELWFLQGPSTYTGQVLVELHLVSCLPLVELLIARFLQAGARAAQAGEFTMRAFLAGKLDLPRAEAVLGVIEARDRQELQEALNQLAGGMTQPLTELRSDLLNLLADIEAGLDFADEDISFVDHEQLLHRLTRALAQVTLVQKQIAQRALTSRPFRVVLAGAPNAGKSSLFNALTGSALALVSEQPGTTRDYLEATLKLGLMRVQIIDTAGQRGTDDLLESQAQSLGRDQMDQADLVLWCVPIEENLPSRNVSGCDNILLIRTKCDLRPRNTNGHSSGDLAVSALDREGLKELCDLLQQKAQAHGGSPLAPSLSRCRHHVDALLDHLRRAHRLVLDQEPSELLALEIRLGLEELGSMVGAIYTDDLLDRIFSRFCIGK